MKPLISIIVPVYNIEQYLARCINSLLAQTYPRLEIILVNDGSTDNSHDICESFSSKDSRIRVIHKENGGLADARNTALMFASGDYLSFIDGDDWVTHDYIEYLYELLHSRQAQISCCAALPVDIEGNAIGIVNKGKTIRTFNKPDALENLLYNQILNNSAAGKLIDSNLFKDITFPVGHLYEDLGTLYHLVDRCSRVVCSTEQKYYYLQRQGSILHQQFSIAHMDSLTFAEEIFYYVRTEYAKNEALLRAAQYRLCVSSFEILIKADPSDKQLSLYTDKAYHYIRRYRGRLMSNSKCGADYRLLFLLSYLGAGFTRSFFNTWKKIKWALFKKIC